MMFMHLQCKTFASLLLVIAGISVAPAGFAQTPDLTLGDDDPVYGIANVLVMENARLQRQRIDIEALLDAVSAQEVASHAKHACARRTLCSSAPDGGLRL